MEYVKETFFSGDDTFLSPTNGEICYLKRMDIHSLDELTRVLQASISPVALVSGVGLLILSQTNRFSRITDRLRELTHLRRTSTPPNPSLVQQINIFHRRARLLRQAISAAVVCVLLASVLVLLVFAMAVLDLPFHLVVLLLFALSLLGLIISLVLFLADMHLALKAVEKELQD